MELLHLKDTELKNVSHPNGAAAGHHKFKNKKTGEEIHYDEGKEGKFGHGKHDHYHRPNPDSKGDHDKYLNKHGEPVPDGHEHSHLYPEEWAWWE